MRSFFRLFMPRSVFVRFAVAFVVVGLLPLAFFTGVVLTRFTDEMEARELRNMDQVTASLADTLNIIIRDLDVRSQNIYLYDSASYGTIGDMIRNDAVMDHRIGYVLSEKYKGMRDFTKSMLDSSAYLRNVIFLDIKNDKAYESNNLPSKTFSTGYDFTSMPIYQQALLTPRALTVSGVHQEAYYQRSAVHVITLARAFLDINALPEREVIIGMLLMDIPAAVIPGVLGGLGEVSAVTVTDARGETLYSAGDAARIGEDSKQFVTISKEIPRAGWTLRYAVDRQTLRASVQAVQGYAAVMIGISALGALLMAMLFSRRLALPLRRISTQMRRVQQGDLTAHVDDPKSDEVGQLAQGFNDMVSELQGFIERSYLAKLGQQEAELNALKMQIHPHFLYNTLEVIRMSALEAEDIQAAEMTQALASQLKYVIGEVSGTVTLGRELEMVQSYVKLVNMRYGNITLKVEVPGALLGEELLKLSLQPVVENAVQHGVRPQGGGTIRIQGEAKDGYLLLTVMDDGAGMTPEQLLRVQQTLEGAPTGDTDPENPHSIGLRNVHQRLHMAYGGESGLTIHSREQVGTVITIRQRRDEA